MGKTSIEWTDCTWNPVRGCTRVSEGCRNCYAERQAARYSGSVDRLGVPLGGKDLPFHGFAENTKAGPRWTGRVELIPHMLDKPLHWREPKRIFVNSMSDLFHEALPFEHIAAVFGVMAACPQHTFQVLTKRPERARAFFAWDDNRDEIATGEYATDVLEGAGIDTGCGSAFYPDTWPLPNVWLGTSVENQETADKRIPELLACPAVVRFVSYEPALGPVDFALTSCDHPHLDGTGQLDEWVCRMCGDVLSGGVTVRRGINWIVVGGESGPEARPFDPAWARSVRDECTAAGVAFFMKQMGRWIAGNHEEFAAPSCWLFSDGSRFVPPIIGTGAYQRPRRAIAFSLGDRKGGQMSEWPSDLRIRQFPEVRA